ncbi:uncharacterized protein YALI1_F05128g [Yarrowia lipolytica]|uniref:Uncharacterized protein n=1 Tax=Yarrowia lipolytica TaxID=4952 RepID=A0A1D8NLV7_YARLL|nr:hypothetical protein YALI1_F05128g [Yarrowia lipolytica]
MTPRIREIKMVLFSPPQSLSSPIHVTCNCFFQKQPSSNLPPEFSLFMWEVDPENGQRMDHEKLLKHLIKLSQ